MIVEGLPRDPRRPGSIRVVIDGRAAWTVPADTVAHLGLVEGQALPGGAVAVLDAAADEEGAVRSAMRMLERRAHGRTELGRKLARKGHHDAATARALDRLDRLGLLDDAAFAAGYVVARAARGSGPARLRRDLTRLGVAAEAVDAALAALEGAEGVDPWERTLAQATRRAAATRSLPRLTRIRRLTAFLARRGFEGDRARRAVDRLVEATEGG